MLSAHEPPRGVLFDHVRALLKRLILARAEWLPDIEDGPSGAALVRFLTKEAPSAEVARALDTLDVRLGGPAMPRSESALDERLRTLGRLLKLSPVAFEFLLVLLAPELDERFLATYRLIWGRPDQRYCDEDFVASLLRVGSVAALRQHVPDDHVLHRLGLVWRRRGADLSASGFRVDDRLLLDLVRQPALPSELVGLVTFTPHEPGPRRDDPWADFPLLDGTRDALMRSRPFVILDGSGIDSVTTMIRQVVSRFGLGCLVADMGRLCQPAGAPRLLADEARTLRMILREARLQNAALVLDGLDALDAVPPPLINLLVEVLRPEPGPVYLIIGRRLGPEIKSRLLAGLEPSFFTVPTPTSDERLAMWNHALAWNGLDVPESGRLRLAAQALGPDAIEQALRVARATRRDVVQVAAEFTRARLSGLATRVPPSLDWDDLVFPERLADELADIAIFARHKTLIADEWGLARSAGGHGIKVLLSGPPGTGKTVVSALLAREAGCELYRVDTSAVVSKWLGETEKHLTELFDVARELGAALLFDEADSLFAKRTEVQTSVDRYANQSVNHLLQLIEDHPGFVVLTTNNDQLLDSAFARRLSFHIKFPSPGQEERALLWRAHLPATVPLGPDVDFEWLALNYELTGGQIRQAAIRAAVAALKHGRRSVGQRDLEVGARAIYAAAGRLPPAFKL